MTIRSRAELSALDADGLVPSRQRLLMWRILFWVLTGGAVFLLVSRLLFPHQRQELVLGAAIAAMCLIGAAVLWLVPHRLPGWLAHAIAATCTIAISLEVFADVRPTSDDELFYLWVTIFAFYFFGRRPALAHMILIGAAYGLAIFLRDDAVPADRLRWMVTIITLTLVGLVIQHLARRQEATIDQLSQAVRTDPLTGLLNRKGFQETFDAALSAAERRVSSFGVIIGDLDRFKQVNDVLGHAAGDETLKTVASLLDASTRGADRPARLGGEEFALLVPEADAAQTVVAAERLRMAVEREFADRRLPVTISFGVAAYPQDGTTADDLMAAADRALYAAKEGGRNRTETNEPNGAGVARSDQAV